MQLLIDIDDDIFGICQGLGEYNAISIDSDIIKYGIPVNQPKQLRVPDNNRKYYSKDFVRGFNLGAQKQYEADWGRLNADRNMEVDDE